MPPDNMISEDEALNYAFGLSDLGRRVINLCSDERPVPFAALARETGSTVKEILFLSTQMQAVGLAGPRSSGPIRSPGIILTVRGMAVKRAVAGLLSLPRSPKHQR